MSKELIIVESPTKAKTLARFLGDNYSIEASMGHVRDLPKSKLGIEIENNFKPVYVIPKDKRKTVEHLKHLAEKASQVVLATDPDREGEAIAWHIAQLLSDQGKNNAKNLKRIVFHEITKEAIMEALKQPREIDTKLVDAQVARRVLDRLVGYKLSPLLWKKIKSGLSAGRVQSVAVKLIVDREREIEAFKAEEYWTIEALLRAADKAKDQMEFQASLVSRNGEKINIKNERDAKKMESDLSAANWQVVKSTKKQISKDPYPPFTTSTMTQIASSQLRYTTKKTMKLAQDLYEEGLITYHRTDSVNLATSSIVAARKFIKESYGSEFIPQKPRIFKTKSKLAQEAHEAIRPTNVNLAANSLNMSNDHKRLYELIWRRFIASQMAEAVYEQKSLEIQANSQKGSYLFKAVGSVMIFSGWQKVYLVKDESEEEKKIPDLKEKDILDLVKLLPIQHFTEPPPRYTEASLIKTLEEKGIGRPSTYAPIISTIQERRYVELENRRFRPTPVGVATNDFLVKNFPSLINDSFTAKMENDLDNIAAGHIDWIPVIKSFYGPFADLLEKVSNKSDRVKIFPELTEEKCPEGHPLVIRYGPYGKFLACEKFPEHQFTKQFESLEFKQKKKELEGLNLKCPQSGHDIIIKQNRRGRIFYGCLGYPKCKWSSWKLPAEEGR